MNKTINRRIHTNATSKIIKYGDTIGIYSPSSPVTYTSKRFERAKSYLQQKGFHILEGSLTGRYDYYRSGSIQERAEELNALIRNLMFLVSCQQLVA